MFIHGRKFAAAQERSVGGWETTASCVRGDNRLPKARETIGKNPLEKNSVNFFASVGDGIAPAGYGMMKMFAVTFLQSMARARRSVPSRYVHVSVIAALLLGMRGMAADFPFTFTRDGDAYRLTLTQNSAVYFGLKHTSDLNQPFGILQLALGTPGPIFEYTPLPDEMQGFFRLEGIPNYAPHDSDFDGMDDIWELEHPYLDPLDPTDALTPSPNFPGLTNLDEYRVRFGLGSNKPQYYSREVSPQSSHSGQARGVGPLIIRAEASRAGK